MRHEQDGEGSPAFDSLADYCRRRYGRRGGGQMCALLTNGDRAGGHLPYSPKDAEALASSLLAVAPKPITVGATGAIELGQPNQPLELFRLQLVPATTGYDLRHEAADPARGGRARSQNFRWLTLI